MFRFCLTSRIHRLSLQPRCISSSSRKPVTPPDSVENVQIVPQQGRHHLPGSLSPLSTSSFSRSSVMLVSTTLFSAVLASIAFFQSDYDRQRQSNDEASNNLYATVEQAINKLSDSYKQVFHHLKQTGVVASVLWHSLTSVLSSANYEVRSGFEIRVAAFLADVAAANSSRRAAIVGAGGGAVVDWLLESVAVAKDGGGTQAESARALAYLIADPNVSAGVLGRPHAIPNLLKFIFSCQPRRSKKVTLPT